MDLRNPMSHLDPGAHHLYLVPGFDPGGTRTLLRLLRHELAQAEPPLKLQGLGHRGHLSQWVVQRRGGGGNGVPLAWISVLSWDDIVRRRWARTPWRLCWQGLLLYLDYLARPRTWHSMRRLPKASFTFFWPLCFVLILALAALLSLLPLALLPPPPAAAFGNSGAVGLVDLWGARGRAAASELAVSGDSLQLRPQPPRGG